MNVRREQCVEGRVAVGCCQWRFSRECEEACCACFHFATIISCWSLSTYSSNIFVLLFFVLVLSAKTLPSPLEASTGVKCCHFRQIRVALDNRGNNICGAGRSRPSLILVFRLLRRRVTQAPSVCLCVWKKTLVQVYTKRLDYYITQPFR